MLAIRLHKTNLESVKDSLVTVDGFRTLQRQGVTPDVSALYLGPLPELEIGGDTPP